MTSEDAAADFRVEREFQIFEGLDWPSEVAQLWQDLTKENPDASYAQTYYWNRACLEHLGFPASSTLLIVSRLDDKVEAVFPFIVDERRRLGYPMRVLRLPRHVHVDLHDVAISPDIGRDRLVSDLLAFLKTTEQYACDLIDFGHLTESSSAYGLFCNDGGSRFAITRRRVCNHLPVMSEDQLNSVLSKNMRASLRKARNRLQSLSGVRFLSTRDPELLPEYFDRFLEVEASGWKGEEGAGTAISLDARLVAFYRQLLASFGQHQECEINILEAGGRVAAAQFALVVHQTMYLLKIGYDQSLSGIAPGNLLLAHTLSRLHEQGEITNVNLITDARWHSRWQPAQRLVYEAKCYADSPAGIAAYLHARARVVLDSWRKSVAAWVA